MDIKRNAVTDKATDFVRFESKRWKVASVLMQYKLWTLSDEVVSIKSIGAVVFLPWFLLLLIIKLEYASIFLLGITMFSLIRGLVYGYCSIIFLSFIRLLNISLGTGYIIFCVCFVLFSVLFGRLVLIL